MKPLDSVGASMYVSEIRDLVNSLLFRIHTITQARSGWLGHNAAASTEASASPSTFSHDAFAHASNAAVAEQTAIFDAFEALLSAWARLSLLFHPIAGKDELGEWRQRRGDILRTLLNLPHDTLLSSRTFRDS
jgi:hypothetical protein